MLKNFFKQHVLFSDYIFMALIAIGFLFSVILFSLNDFDFHYTTITLFAGYITSLSWIKCIFAIILAFIFYFYGLSIRHLYPRSATFIWGVGLYFWTLMLNVFLTNGLQATPFSPIDNTLVKWDQWIGINTPALMAWTYAHPHLHKLFVHAYDFLGYELAFIPLVLMMCNARKAMVIFFIAELSSFLIGALIYYFFPTMAPSGVFHNIRFSAAQYNTSLRFYEVHHFLKIHSTEGGLIAFPSFHVIWAILLTNAVRAKKLFFYPLACVNATLIAATVFLGWHYFVDVIAAAILALLAIAFAEYVYRRDARK